jgi:hypothetical protein
MPKHFWFQKQMLLHMYQKCGHMYFNSSKFVLLYVKSQMTTVEESFMSPFLYCMGLLAWEAVIMLLTVVYKLKYMINQYFNFAGSDECIGFCIYHVLIVLLLGYKISCLLADVCHCFEIHWNSNIQGPSERGYVISVLIVVKWPFMLQEADFMWIVIPNVCMCTMNSKCSISVCLHSFYYGS